ncbi:MAG: hypothetical protein HY859_20100 [Caulobacterales bacterium]|nr:hypothetical protein [Caulobacterales bacterium]
MSGVGRIFWAVFAAAALLGTSSRAADAGWTVVIEQEGRTQAFQGEVHLKRVPFRMVFSGPKDEAYAVLGGLEANGLAERATPEGFAELAGPVNVYAFDQEPSSYLILNRAPLDPEKASYHSWYDSDEDGVHSFQEQASTSEGRARVVRVIDEIMVDDDDAASGPIGATPVKRACLLIAAIDYGPRFRAPKFACLVFDP